MKDFLNIALFTLVVSLVYTGIAQILPQLEGKAPPRIEFGSDTSPEDLASLGAEVFNANCTQCHKMAEAGRCPPLGNIGSEQRVKYGVVGDTVNMTGRIESLTVGGQALLRQATYAHIETLVEVGEQIRCALIARLQLWCQRLHDDVVQLFR